MRTALFSIGVAALLSSASATTAQPAERYLSHPEWDRKPSATEFMELLVRTAGKTQAVGWALLKCQATAKGDLSSCKVVIETPDPGPLGKFALRLSSKFKLRPMTKDGESVEGGAVLVPIVVSGPDQPAPPLSYRPGQPSYILTPANKKRPSAKRFACPDGPDKTAVCEALEFYWEGGLSLEESAPIILAAEQTAGVSALFCQLAVAGRLESCQLDGENNPRILTAVSKIRATLKTPKRLDGEPVAPATVAIVYDWAMLTRAAKAITALAEPQAPKAP